MLILEDYGLSLVSVNDTTKSLIEEMIDMEFINDWKLNNSYNEIYETDVLEYYLSKDAITDEQFILLEQYHQYRNSLNEPECSETIIHAEMMAVLNKSYLLGLQLNSFAKMYLLNDICSELMMGDYYEIS